MKDRKNVNNVGFYEVTISSNKKLHQINFRYK